MMGETKTLWDFFSPLAASKAKVDIPAFVSKGDKRKKSLPVPKSTDTIVFRINTIIQSSLNSPRPPVVPTDNAAISLLVEKIKTLERNPGGDPTSSAFEVKILRNTAVDTELSFDRAFYLVRTERIMEQYRLASNVNRPSFFCPPSEDALSDTKADVTRNHALLDSLTHRFLRIAAEYIHTDSKDGSSQQASKVCEACGLPIRCSKAKEFDLYQEYLLEDDRLPVCACGNVIDILNEDQAFLDSERLSATVRANGSSRGHFIESMDCFEAKQSVTIPPAVLTLLRDQTAFHGIERITKNQIYMFLLEARLADQYRNVNLIHYLLTGENPPNITYLRHELLDMHDQLEEAYAEEATDSSADKTGKTWRLNSVNWKLYKFLQLLEYPCKKDDFFCLRTLSKQMEHEEKWGRGMEILAKMFPNHRTSKGEQRWRLVRGGG